MIETCPSSEVYAPLLRMTEADVGHSRPALIEHVNWDIRAQECWALVGANGAGKTTLLATLVALRDPLSGVRSVARQTSIGFISQRPDLASRIPLTLEDFVSGGDVCAARLWPRIGRGRRELREKVATLLAEVGLTAQAKTPFATLSEGMQQRAWVARALLARPQVLVLDEPTSAMDPRQEARALALLARLAKQYDAALVVVGHHLDALMSVCTHVAFIDIHRRLHTGPRAKLEEKVGRALRPEGRA